MKSRRTYRYPSDGVNYNRIRSALDAGAKNISQISIVTQLGRSTITRLLANHGHTELLPQGARRVRATPQPSLTQAQREELLASVEQPPTLIGLRVKALELFGIHLLDVLAYRLMRQYKTGQSMENKRYGPKYRALSDEQLHALMLSVYDQWIESPSAFSIQALEYAVKVMYPTINLGRSSLYNYHRRLRVMLSAENARRRDEGENS